MGNVVLLGCAAGSSGTEGAGEGSKGCGQGQPCRQHHNTAKQQQQQNNTTLQCQQHNNNTNTPLPKNRLDNIMTTAHKHKHCQVGIRDY